MTVRIPRTSDIAAAGASPIRCLLVPGLNDSGPDHWQTLWQRSRDDCVRVELGDWDAPTRAGWVARIDAAVVRSDTPVVLVGHSLGCLAIVWWAAAVRRSTVPEVAGAMLVAPPDVGQQGCDVRLLRFAPVPATTLPFPTLVVASENDRYATPARSRALVEGWGAAFADVGRAGHINAGSELGDWPQGQALLASLIGGSASVPGGRCHDR